MSQEEKKDSEESTSEEKDKSIPEDKLSVTHHSVTINGKELNYTATTGTLVLKAEDEKEGEYRPRIVVRDDVVSPVRRGWGCPG